MLAPLLSREGREDLPRLSELVGQTGMRAEHLAWLIRKGRLLGAKR